MNKIFKIVFNAARGKMMVVNEATSSVQTGKKAAVTVAVVGALVSGVALADSVVTKTDTTLDSDVYGGTTITTGAHNVDSTGIELLNVTSSKSGLYLVGGPVIKGNTSSSLEVGSAENETDNKLASTVSIRNSKWSGTSFVVGAGMINGSSSNYKAQAKYFGTGIELVDVEADGALVIGGGKVYNAGLGEMEVTNTYVTLKGDTVVNSVIGGSFVSGAKSKTTVLKTDTTNVYIGEGVTVKGKVVGGHYSNFYGKNATVNTTNVVIDGECKNNCVWGL